ncbi:MAG: hypothetical protein ACREID_00705, partial [Planctomycetota bacterium]
QEWWARTTRNADGTERQRSAGLIRTILREAKEGGYDRDPAFWKPKEEELYRELLLLAPSDPDANRSAGRVDLRELPGFAELWESVGEHYTELPPKFRGLVADLETRVEAAGPVWLEPADYAAKKAVLEELSTWLKEMEASPTAAAVQKGINSVRADPILKDYDAVPVIAPPFIVFLGSRELKPVDGTKEEQERVAKKRAELEERSKKYHRLYSAFLATFEERYRKPLNLPPFQPTDILYQWIFEDRQGFEKYNVKAQGHEVGANVLGYFDPKTRWVLLYQSEDEPGKRIDDLNVMAHESTHQLHWFFARDPKNRFENYFDEMRAVWFTEGWAEYVGGSCRFHPQTDQPEFSWYALGRVDTLRDMKKHGMPMIPLVSLVEREDYAEFQRWLIDEFLPAARETAPESAHPMLHPLAYMGVLYAQSWLFVHYLNTYGDGKYRRQFLDLVETALRGRRKPVKYRKDPNNPDEKWRIVYDAFTEIFGIAGEADWERMQREYDETVERVLREAPPSPKKEERKEEKEETGEKKEDGGTPGGN